MNFPYAANGLSAFRQVGKTKGMLGYSKSVHSNTLFGKLKIACVNCETTHSEFFCGLCYFATLFFGLIQNSCLAIFCQFWRAM